MRLAQDTSAQKVAKPEAQCESPHVTALLNGLTAIITPISMVGSRRNKEAQQKQPTRQTLTAGIFDVDGVLLASPHERAWREALTGLAEPARFTTSIYQARVAGRPRLDGAKRAMLSDHPISMMHIACLLIVLNWVLSCGLPSFKPPTRWRRRWRG